MSALPALTVDKEGLARSLARRGIEFCALELIQNAFDESVTKITVTLEHAGRGLHRLTVIDDSPTGWRDLADAHCLFADSYKKNDPSKRGKFNMGEKLVVALAREARLVTTTGGWHWTGNTRRRLRSHTEAGSEFWAILPMTVVEAERTCEVIGQVLVPEDITLKLLRPHGSRFEIVCPRQPLRTFEMTLPTEVADAEHRLVRTRRKTEVRVFKRLAGEPEAYLYELGLPVVQLDGGDTWHLDIAQRVPVGMDRDNVSPAYLRRLRSQVLNVMADQLEDSCSVWVDQALEDPDVEPAAVDQVLTSRYGAKRVAYDPSDPEASKRAASEGYSVIHGGSFNRAQWDNIRESHAIRPAGQVTPTRSPEFSADGEDVTVPRDQWTNGMAEVIEWTEVVAEELLGLGTRVGIINSKQPFEAMFSPTDGMDFNLGSLGNEFFSSGISDDLIELVIHELGHDFSGDHLSSKYHEGLCTLAQRLARLVVRRPGLFPADSRTWRKD
jgi:hypothetical protein